jgi:hypothetical protein
MNKFSKEVLKLIRTCNSATILDVDCETMISQLFEKQLQQELDEYKLVYKIEPSDCIRHLLIKEFNKTEIGLYRSTIIHKSIFTEGKQIEIYIREAK